MDWFRFYTEVRNDNKLRLLSDAQHRVWVHLMCLAGEQEQRGTLVGFSDFLLAAEVANGDIELYRATRDLLIELRILQRGPDESLSFINWQKRQYVKPSAEPERVRERVAKHRASVKASTETPVNEATGICNTNVTRCNADERAQIADTETELITTPPKARAKVVPSPIARDTAEVLVNAPWVRDDEDAVAAAVERSFKLAPAFDCRDGPLVAEKYVRAKKYQTKPPDDWYRAWLNFVKSERSPHERSTTNGAPKRIDPASQTSPVLGPDPYTSGRFAQYVTKPTG